MELRGLETGQRSMTVGDPVRRRIDDEPDRADRRLSHEPCLRDPVPAVHQGAVEGQDDREPQIRSVDPTCVIGNLPAARCLTMEPTVLIELGDVVDRHFQNRQLTGQRPQPVCPEVMPAPRDDTGMMLAVHLGSLDERGP